MPIVLLKLLGKLVHQQRASLSHEAQERASRRVIEGHQYP